MTDEIAVPSSLAATSLSHVGTIIIHLVMDYINIGRITNAHCGIPVEISYDNFGVSFSVSIEGVEEGEEEIKLGGILNTILVHGELVNGEIIGVENINEVNIRVNVGCPPGVDVNLVKNEMILFSPPETGSKSLVDIRYMLFMFTYHETSFIIHIN